MFLPEDGPALPAPVPFPGAPAYVSSTSCVPARSEVESTWTSSGVPGSGKRASYAREASGRGGVAGRDPCPPALAQPAARQRRRARRRERSMRSGLSAHGRTCRNGAVVEKDWRAAVRLGCAAGPPSGAEMARRRHTRKVDEAYEFEVYPPGTLAPRRGGPLRPGEGGRDVRGGAEAPPARGLRTPSSGCSREASARSSSSRDGTRPGRAAASSGSPPSSIRAATRCGPSAPPDEESRRHHYLWRFWKRLPGTRRGRRLRPQLVRPGAGGAGRGLRDQAGVEARLRRDQRLRADAHRRRRPDDQVLPPHRPEDPARAVQGPRDRPVQAATRSARTTGATAAAGRTTRRPSTRCSTAPTGPMRRGC